MRSVGRWAATVVVLVGPWFMAPTSTIASEVPGGFFYTEALPGRLDGAGFAVQDGHGAKLWTAFQQAGGVDALGYPISRRFDLDGRVAQAFSSGSVLVWSPADAAAEVRQLNRNQLPSYATQPDQPPEASAEIQPRPWSGWWWPANDSGPTLYAPDGPLDKYDRYVAAITGQDPGTRAWERQEIYFPSSRWAGHCNGFAAASLLEAEPTEAREILGVTFGVADLKGLLVDYHFGDEAVWSFGAVDDLNPADFHRMLLDWMRGEGKGFVLTYDLGGGEVWSYPVYRFETTWSMDAVEADVWHARTTLWMADMDVPADFVGTRPFPGPGGKTFEYTLRGDPRRPSEGEWTGPSKSGRFAHPARIWYPNDTLRQTQRDLVAPGFDRQTLSNILAGSDGTVPAGAPRLGP